MPRKARIDAPGALHHIIVRGIERLRIFSDDQDRDNLLNGWVILSPRRRLFALQRLQGLCRKGHCPGPQTGVGRRRSNSQCRWLDGG
jgi:hypothetical protein